MDSRNLHRLIWTLAAVAVIVGIVFAFSRCTTTSSTGEQKAGGKTQAISARVHFDSDSAFSYVQKQVAIGPRVAGTEGGRRCADYIMRELRRHGADEVTTQDATVEAYNGDQLSIRNIFARFNPQAKRRVLLVAHYDTRPWADSDDTEENRSLPIPGANDGGSGVAVMLEIARHLGEEPAQVGVDMLFVDAEDYGKSSGFSAQEKTWCLGTQYFVDHMPYTLQDRPAYGVLFDMVGGMDAKFHREFLSENYARAVVDKVWDVANRSGYGDRFVNKPGGAVVDDHLFLSRAGIPTVDIIESKNDDTKSFPSTWHTMSDDLQHIDPASLKAAGQTVLNLIYLEPAE